MSRIPEKLGKHILMSSVIVTSFLMIKGETVAQEIQDNRAKITDIVGKEKGENITSEQRKNYYLEMISGKMTTFNVFLYFSEFKDEPWAEEILTMGAEKTSYFAFEYADQYISEPYAEKILIIAAKINSFAALKYANKYISEPYAEKILIMAAEQNPYFAFEYAENYISEPYAEKILIMATKKTPYFAFEYAEKYISKPYAEKILSIAAEINPGVAFYYIEKYISEPYAEKILIIATKKDPRMAMYYADQYISEPYAEKILSIVAEKDPGVVIYYAEKYISEPYAEKILIIATEKDPDYIINIMGGEDGNWRLLNRKTLKNIRKTLENIKNPPPSIKILLEIDKTDFKYQDQTIVKQEIATLLDELVRNNMTISEAANIRISNRRFFEKLIEIKKRPDHLGSVSVENKLSIQALMVVEIINDLHEKTEKERFASVKDFTPEQIYILMTYGEEEVFTSTFNGLFNRLLEKMKKNNVTGDQLLSSIGNLKWRTFIKECASFNRLNEFLSTIDETKQKAFLEKFVKNIEKEDDMLAEAVIIADVFSVINDPKVLKVLQTTIKGEYKRVQLANNKEAEVLYRLLADLFSEKNVINDDWLQEVAQKYKLENVTNLSSKDLFNNDGSNVQQYFFYNDKDGHASFQSFLAQYQNKSDWKIEKNESFVHIVSIKEGKSLEIYANFPDKEADGPEAISEEFKTRDIQNIVIVHCGHSYYSQKTIDRITPIAKIVSLGSCGGYNNVSIVLNKSPDAHIMSTEGTGTMLVNDLLFKMLNEEILSDKDIQWSEFWGKAEKKLGSNQDFSNYIPPHRNFGVLFLKAYNKLISEK